VLRCAVAVPAPGIGTAVRYSSSSASSTQLPSARPSNPPIQATVSVPLQRPGLTLCSTSVTTSPRMTTSQRQPVVVPGHAAPVFVGQFGMHPCGYLNHASLTDTSVPVFFLVQAAFKQNLIFLLHKIERLLQ